MERLYNIPTREYSEYSGEIEITDHHLANACAFQCIYTFVAGEGARVKLDFEQFQLAGTSEK